MLTPEEYQVVLRHDFRSFVHRSFLELNPQATLLGGDHIDVIAGRLHACLQGSIKRLIINVPPRHLKSHCASVAFPAWALGHHPTAHIICASYGQDLADKLARDSRTVMQSSWYKGLFPTRLADRQATHDFATTKRGTRMATSIGGVLTGRGADIIIIDDPLKPDDALSESRRKAVNQWYDNTLRSRLNDKVNGRVVIVMQRLHQDDLVGHVLEQEDWVVVSFPAIAEQAETHLIESPLGNRWFKRQPGDILHPERESATTLASMRRMLGEYNFASQYQQNPAPLGGAMIKTDWLRYYALGDKPGEFSLIVQSWDTANKAADLNDFSVCTTWGLADRRFYLLDVFRRRLNYPDLRRAVIDQAGLYNPDTILIEDKASGTQLIQDLKSEVYGIKGYDPPSGTDKTMRLHAQSAVLENGFVLLPQSAPWLADYVAELTGFPGTRFDDQVDSTTQALDHLKAHVQSNIWERL